MKHAANTSHQRGVNPLGNRLMGRDHSGRRLGAALARLLLLAGQSSKNTVGDPCGKHIRPLVNGLVSDADCLRGGGDRTPQKFDGFRLKHASLNHSSGHLATIVQRLFRTIGNHG
jgi:hypothetical protein